MTEVTPELVRAFWHHMSTQFGSTVTRKERSILMKLVACVLACLRIMPARTFVTRYATTIGRRIYVPFEVGVADSAEALWHQIELCAHEHQHIAQLERLGCRRFWWRYLTSRAKRTAYEAEAYTSNLELHFWRTGVMPSRERVAKKLESYAVSSVDVAVAQTQLEMAAEAISRGAIVNRASKVALDFLIAEAPELWGTGEEASP